jgi:hypothetical protein
MTRSRDVADTQDNLGGAVAPFAAGKNKIINGDFGVWQRGISFTTQSVYGPDRWFLTGVTSNMTFAQVTSSLPSAFQYGIKLQRNSGATNTDIFSIAQPFETATSIPLQGQTVALSFWAKAGANFSASSGFGLIRLYSGTGTNQSASTQFGGWTGYSEWQNTNTFSPTTIWTRFTCTGTVPSNATQIGLRIGWSATGTAGADDSLQIAGVQLEAGNLATPFTTASGSIGGEFALCQRYYETGTGYQSGRNGAGVGDNHPWVSLTGTSFQVAKRAASTITLGTPTNSNCYTNSGNTFNITVAGFAQTLLYLTGGTVANMSITQPWTASAEL